MAIALSSITPEMLEQAVATLARPPRPGAADFNNVRDGVFYDISMIIRHYYRPGGARPCRRVALVSDWRENLVELEVHTLDGRTPRIPLRVTPGTDTRNLMYVGFERICMLFWNATAEAFNRDPSVPFDWRNHVELRNRIEDASQGRPPRPRVEDGYRALGLDLGDGPAESYLVASDGRGGRHAVPIGRYQGMEFVESRNMTATEVQAATRRFLLEQAQLRRDLASADQHQAEARGLTLLMEWLSPAQLEQYKTHCHFDVTGQSGKRYRIKHGRVQNVYELDREDREICGWCFAPEGNLVPGDVMLAQKVALETNERGALKVANKFAAPGTVYGSSQAAVMVWAEEAADIDLRPGAINRVADPTVGFFRSLLEGRWT